MNLMYATAKFTAVESVPRLFVVLAAGFPVKPKVFRFWLPVQKFEGN